MTAGKVIKKLPAGSLTDSNSTPVKWKPANNFKTHFNITQPLTSTCPKNSEITKNRAQKTEVPGNVVGIPFSRPALWATLPFTEEAYGNL